VDLGIRSDKLDLESWRDVERPAFILGSAVRERGNVFDGGWLLSRGWRRLTGRDCQDHREIPEQTSSLHDRTPVLVNGTLAEGQIDVTILTR
jgi:hypothetical protein